MRHLAALIVALFATTAIAQEQEKFIATQAPCASWIEMNKLATKHGEQPLFTGEGLTFQAGTGQVMRGGMLFTVDQDQGNWTVFQIFADGNACMLFNGSKFKPWSGPVK